MTRKLAILLAIFGLGKFADAQDFRAYQIGNSLTVTATPSGSIENWLASTRGEILQRGYHIRCGQPLIHTLLNREAETCVNTIRGGNWFNALSNFDDWDMIVFQPHPGISNLGDDVTAIKTWIALAEFSGNTADYYVMQGYPTRFDYGAKWNASIPNALHTPTAHADEYYQHLMERVRAQNPNANIYLIPVGETFDLLDERLSLNPIEVNGMVLDGAEDLYRDDIHGNMQGGFASGAAIFASLFGREVSALNSTNSGNRYGSEEINWSPELYALIHEAVYDAHVATPYAKQLTSVSGDVDRNGQIDFSDIPPFVGVLLGRTYQEEADIDEDGVVGFSDVTPFVGVLIR